MLKHPSHVAFAPDGLSLAAKSTTGALLLVDTASADPIAHFKPTGRDEGANLKFASGSTIVDASWTGEVRCREIADLEPEIPWRDDSVMLARVMHARAAYKWSFVAQPIDPSGKRPGFLLASKDLKTFRPGKRSWPLLRDAAIAPQGDRVAVQSGGQEPKLEILLCDDEHTLAAASVTQGGTGTAIEWSPDASLVACAEKGGFSFRSATDLREVGWLPSEYPSSISFSEGGGMIALGDWKQGLVAPWPELLDSLRPRPTGAA